MKKITVISLLLVSALIGCATSNEVSTPEKSAYNRAVEAWRSKNYVLARQLWSAAIVEGANDEAYNNLGHLLYYGLGGAEDAKQAVNLFRKGAALGVSEAQRHLGVAFEEGRGVKINYAQAYAWYKCAVATAGANKANEPIEETIEKDSKAAMEAISLKMTITDRVEGDRLANIYISKYASRLALLTL
ncbi:tetratricopeptide repeat protein [Uliginosibacterium sediminicola]|uniref:Tetratricopeptide repeat protein n=1 Tax=Uliginosibacterium sediminicola TaxID=2024550 RepID=A0ABU9YXS8_9RHOO